MHWLLEKAANVTVLSPKSKIVFRILNDNQVNGKSTGSCNYIDAYAMAQLNLLIDRLHSVGLQNQDIKQLLIEKIETAEK